MPLTLRTTLCETRDALHVLRRALFIRDHTEAMESIDTHTGFAEDEAVQAISAIDRAEFRRPILVSVANPAEPTGIVVPTELPTRLAEPRELGLGLSSYCGNPRCGHLRLARS